MAELAVAIREAHRVWRSGEDLYGGWYAAARPGIRVPAVAPGSPPLAGQLRVAHSRRWLAGCRVTATGLAGTVVVTTPDGHARAVSAGDHHLPGRPGRPARVGDDVVTVDRAGGYESEGWWRAWGGGWDVTRLRPDVTRVYLAVRPDRVVELARVLPDALDGAALCWSLKIAAQPEMLARPDAAVLYVLDADRDAVLALLPAVVGDLVEAPTPPLASVFVPGIAWSEDPGTEQSFGQNRCELLATAFIAGGDDPVAAAQREFVRAGLEWTQPHLRGGDR
ncbi:MAG: hypothetical protein LCH96_00140 [Actinobacteria bacterium]|nr:hypothetical protein [Actinomycetota bacterium]